MRHAIDTLDMRVGIFAAIVFTACVWLLFGGRWAPDMSALYFAARFNGLGLEDQMYLAPSTFFGGSAAASWQAMAADLGHPGEPALPYVYPPIWAVLLSPIATRVGPQPFFDAVLLAQTGLFIACVPLAYRIAGPGGLRFWQFSLAALALVFISMPVLIAFSHNQPQIAVTFLILLAFERAGRGAAVAAGVALGLAVAIKILPILLILVFMMERNWRAACVTVATAAVLALASLALAGIGLHLDFLHQLATLKANTILTPLNFSAQALATGLADTLAGQLPATGGRGFAIKPSRDWPVLVGNLVALGGLAVLWRRTAGFREAGRPYLRLVGVWSLTMLCSALTWNHYMIGLVVLMPGMFTVLPPRQARIVLVVFGIVTSRQLEMVLADHQAPVLAVMAMGATTLAAVFALCLYAATPFNRTLMRQPA